MAQAPAPAQDATAATAAAAAPAVAAAPSAAAVTAQDFYGSTEFWKTWKKRRRKPECKEEGEGCTCFEGVGSVF